MRQLAGELRRTPPEAQTCRFEKHFVAIRRA